MTVENILDRQSPRNRRIADIFAKCGLVERSGQGMNLMFELSVKSAKALPDFRGTDRYHVTLRLDGQVQDSKLLEMMEKIGQETLESFSTQDFLVVNAVYREQTIPESLRERLPRLLDLGIVERAAKGRFILDRRFYTATGKKGAYTRKKGLDRETNKALLLKHICEIADEGSRLEDLTQVLPNLSTTQVQNLVRELKREHRVFLTGTTRGGKWFPVVSEAEGLKNCVKLTTNTQSERNQRLKKDA